MNLVHLKYAVEIEKTRSISKAAENLLMAQPNLSRAVKELEESLGITIFRRTSRGILVTAEGEEFLRRARSILAQVEEVENYYKYHKTRTQKFSVSVPRAAYISDAFGEVLKQVDSSLPCEIYFKEAGYEAAIDNILQEGFGLGIIRFQREREGEIVPALESKGLRCEPFFEFVHVVAVSKFSSLAAKQVLGFDDLKGRIEIAFAEEEFEVPALNRKQCGCRRICVFERGSQADLLRSVPNTYAWCSPMPQQTLESLGLAQLECKGEERVFKDMLIYPEGYRFSELDKLFMAKVRQIAGLL